MAILYDFPWAGGWGKDQDQDRDSKHTSFERIHEKKKTQKGGREVGNRCINASTAIHETFRQKYSMTAQASCNFAIGTLLEK